MSAPDGLFGVCKIKLVETLRIHNHTEKTVVTGVLATLLSSSTAHDRFTRVSGSDAFVSTFSGIHLHRWCFWSLISMSLTKIFVKQNKTFKISVNVFLALNDP